MMLLAVTIDVEPDCSPSWQYSSPLAFEGVSRGIREILHPLLMRYGIAPTYLVNNVVLEDDRSVEVLASLPGRYELGTHLHPEFIGPDKIHVSYAGKKAEMNLCFLPEDVQKEKLRSITNLFAHRFGRNPHSFRAGRFSAQAGTIKCLADLAYRVDTSVTPHVRWSDNTRARPVDFTDAPEQPYLVSQDDILRQDPGGDVLEVPVTVMPVRSLFKKAARWLRPHLSDASTMRRVARTVFRKYSWKEVAVLNMMFHNVEVLPSLSPYCLTEDDVRTYIASLANLFEFLLRRGVEPATLHEVHAAMTQWGDGAVRP
jgi:hypothetical protein